MRYFGTDGIRDIAQNLLCSDIPEILGEILSKNAGTVIIGRDVRTHSAELEKRLIGGLLNGSAEIYVTGVLPTPALSYIAKILDTDYAVMITASHNAPEYNGFKVFSKGGKRMSAAEEQALESELSAYKNNTDGGDYQKLPFEIAAGLDKKSMVVDISTSSADDIAADLLAAESQYISADILAAVFKEKTDDSVNDVYNELKKINSAHRIKIFEGAEYCYKRHILALFPKIDGLKVRLDCANGCLAGLAEEIFSSLGADVTAENNVRDGSKINLNCGSSFIENFLPNVKRNEIGFAFDGDGDRVIGIVDGKVYDGDAMLLALSTLYRLRGKLKRRFLVGTTLSNSRLERELAWQSTALLRTDVGDMFVTERLRKENCILGGEKNGRVFMLDKANTSDGLITALSLLEAKKIMGTLPKFSPYPMADFEFPSEDPIATANEESFKKKCAVLTKRVGAKGRLIIRPSGTEKCVRITVECFTNNWHEVFDAVKTTVAEWSR